MQWWLQKLNEVLGNKKGENWPTDKIGFATKSNYSQITIGNRAAHAEFDEMQSTFFEEVSPAIEWNELARKICKRNEENKLTNQQVLDEIDESEEDYDNEDDVLEQSSEKVANENAELIPVKPKEETSKKPIVPTKAPKEKSTAKPKTTSTTPTVVDSIDENDESESDDDYDYTPEDLDEDSDEDDREDESITGDVEKAEKSKSKNILLDGIKVIKDIDNRIFGKI